MAFCEIRAVETADSRACVCKTGGFAPLHFPRAKPMGATKQQRTARINDVLGCMRPFYAKLAANSIPSRAALKRPRLLGFQDLDEGFLGDVDLADALHPLLTFFLLLEEFAFARD